MHIHTCDRPGVCPTHPPISRSQLQRTYLTLSPRLPCTSARNPLVPADVCGSPHPLPQAQLFCQMLGNFPTPLFSKLLKPESGNTPVGTAPDHLPLSNREVTSAVASWHLCHEERLKPGSGGAGRDPLKRNTIRAL